MSGPADPPFRIACAGNWIVDIVHTIEAWPRKSDLVRISHEVAGVGGGAANVALCLAAFRAGVEIHAVGLLGDDLHADLVRDTCQTAGIGTRWLSARQGVATAHTHVMNVPGDSRTFFYHSGSNDLLAEADVPLDDIAAAGVGVFYLGYPNLLAALDRVEPGGATAAGRLLARARGLGMRTCVDLVSADTPDFAATVAAVLPHTDHLFLNEVEAARATGLPIARADDRVGFAGAAAALLAGGAGSVILHSPALTLWQAAGAAPVWSEPPPLDPGRIVSPLGAGDAFCAGAIFGLASGWPVHRCLTLAHAAAAAALQGATATEAVPTLEALLQG